MIYLNGNQINCISAYGFSQSGKEDKTDSSSYIQLFKLVTWKKSCNH